MFALLSLIFQHNAVYIESFSKFCRRNFVVCFFGVLRVKMDRNLALIIDILCLPLKRTFIEPRCEKTGLWGFRPGPTQTRLHSDRRWWRLEIMYLGRREIVLSV